MEDYFKSNVCSLCSNKSKNCSNIQIITATNYYSIKCLNYKRKRCKKKGDYDIEEYFINKLAPTTTKQEKLNADYYQC